MAITKVSEFVLDDNSITAAKLKVLPGTNGQVLAIDSSYNFYFTDIVPAEGIDDRIASLIAAGTHTNITIVYDDVVGSLSFSATGTVTSVNSQSGVIVLDTDDISEGLTNQYFTNTRARNSISAAGDLSYNPTTGVLSVTTYKTTNFNTDFAAKSTTDLAEGINLYYTDTRARDAISVAGDLSYNPTTGVLSVTTYKTSNFNTDFASKSTTDLAEGINLYFTDSRARSSISVIDNGGDGSISYNSSTGAITYTGPSATEVRSHFSGGTGVTITDGIISIGQDVSVSSNVEFNNISATGNIQIDGNLIVSGTTTTVSATNLSVSDNMIYMNQAIATTISNAVGNGSQVVYTTQENHNYLAGYSVTVIGVTPSSYNVSNQTIVGVTQNTFTVSSTVTDTYVSGGTARGRSNANPDLGIAFGYYDVSYQHGGFFRDASDGIFKIFKGYTPEPDSSPYIDTGHASFALADFQANTIYSSIVGNVTGTVSSLSNHTTTNLTEGTNLYYTDTRARDAISVSGDLSYNSSTGVLSVTTYKTTNFNTDFASKSTTDLSEGTNLYFTNTRARDAISVSGDLSYNTTTGVLSVTTYKTTNFNTDFASKSTTDLSEGTNLYFTNTRARDAISVSGDLSYNTTTGVLSVTTYKTTNFNTDFASKSTTDLSEGTNLYFTNARARNAITATGDLSYNSTTGVLSVTTYKTTNFNTDFAAKSTTDLSEGTNLYFTNERVDDRVSSLLVAGANVDIVYDDVAGTLTVSSFSNGGYDLSNNTTDDLTEGTTNLYYTDGRVKSLLSTIINDVSEFGSLSYNGSTQKIDYVGVTSSDIRSTLSANTGISYNSLTGVIGLDSSASVQFNNMTLTGNLTVSGNTTFVNTVELTVSDNIITLNAGLGSLESPTLNSGIEVNRGIENDVGIRWNETTDKWQFTNDGIAYQNIGSLSASSTDDLSEGTVNLYYTNARADARVDILRTDLTVDGDAEVHFNNLTNVPVVTKDVFTGNGTQTDFTLSASPGSPDALIVTLNGVTQTPGGDYSVSGTTLSFINPLPSGQVAIIRHVGYQVVGGTTGSYLSISGGTMSGSILVNADNTYDLGTTTNQWRAVYGHSITATYADLAERYEADNVYEAGTVVVFGGEKEITLTNISEDVSVAGVISTNPAYKMNSQAGADSTHPYVALRGRVPCKVVGPVKKGDLLVTSEIHGFAKSVGKVDKGLAVFAKSLTEDLSSGQKIIEVVII